MTKDKDSHEEIPAIYGSLYNAAANTAVSTLPFLFGDARHVDAVISNWHSYRWLPDYRLYDGQVLADNHPHALWAGVFYTIGKLKNALYSINHMSEFLNHHVEFLNSEFAETYALHTIYLDPDKIRKDAVKLYDLDRRDIRTVTMTKVRPKLTGPAKQLAQASQVTGGIRYNRESGKWELYPTLKFEDKHLEFLIRENFLERDANDFDIIREIK